MVGYSNTGSADYLKQMNEKVAIRKNRDHHVRQGGSHEGEKAKFLGEAIKDIDPELAVQTYRPIDQIIELDEQRNRHEGISLLISLLKFARN